MTDEEKNLEEWFAPLREDSGDDSDGHPTSDELDAYYTKELSPEDDARIREHLAACQECADLLVDLQELYAAASEPATGVVDFEQANAWKKLRKKLFPPKALGLPLPVLAFAAALAVVTVGFLVYQAGPFGPRGEVTLDPVGAFRGGEVEEIVAAPRSSDLVLRVAGRSYPEYRVEIRQGDTVVKTLSGLREDEPLNVPLGDLGSSLEPGKYEIVLFGRGPEGTLDKIGTYEVFLKDS